MNTLKQSSSLMIRSWRGPASLWLAVLVLPVFVTASAPAAPLRAQPVLLELAAHQPDSAVSVIVQKTVTDSRLEALVRELGGAVTAELSIINAFAATLPAHAVETLAAAPGVKWVSLDAPLEKSGSPISTVNLASAYIRTIRADQVWNAGPKYLQGEGIGVAVVDSGVDASAMDLAARFQTGVRVTAIKQSTMYSTFVSVTIRNSSSDPNGHGTHVAGIIGGSGAASNGRYIGVAPGVNLISVQISDLDGRATTGNIIHALGWILENKDTYNIRVVNISLNSGVAESYRTSPLAAAAEILWFNQIVVVASAGNNGSATLYPPANDPFVITVGAADDKGTPSLADDSLPGFSAYGTPDGFAKPDLVAPGANIVSVLSSASSWRVNYPGRMVQNGNYFRLSGTSMAAPMVSGAVALLLQDEPNLTPDQVKYRLKATANKSWSGYNAARAGAGYLDVYAAVYGSTTQSANTGITASQFLWTGTEPLAWGSASWNSASWNSASWNSASWNSASWNSASWNSTYWGP